MVERQDIDALLISALYGELTPADETRLATHLDSHPADRVALADLTWAREAVRESRILQVQLDPPQSISALLLQEAARRAPKKPAEEGWFQRFVRSFMAHPALAAAAMLVVVIGFATVISTRKGDQFTESTAPSADHGNAAIVTTSEPGGTAFQTNKDQGAVAPTGGDRGEQGQGSGAAYRVGLDDSVAAPKGQAEQQLHEAAPVVADPYGKADTARNESLEADRFRMKAEYKPSDAKKPSAPAKVAPKDPGYIELRKQEPGPKDLDAPKNKAGTKSAFDQEAANEPSSASDKSETGDRIINGRGAFGGAGGAAAGKAPDSNTTAKAPAQAPPPVIRNSLAQATPAAPPPPPPARPPAATSRDGGATTDKTVTRAAPAPAPAEDKPDPQYEWASAQHKRVTKQVRDGNCQDAATLALDIAKRAPSYYQQNVATDRELKKCLAYINTEREKEAERQQRAKPSKRAMDEAPKAADRPSATTK
jgi:hypothetical protein